MNNWTVWVIIIAIVIIYSKNQVKINNMLGIETVTSASSEQNGHSGINYVKLENVNSLNVGVHLISASWCGYCTKMRKLLKKNNIPFTEYNVEDDDLVNEYIDKNNIGNGVPVTVVGGDVVHGYDEDGLKRALKQNGIKINGI